MESQFMTEQERERAKSGVKRVTKVQSKTGPPNLWVLNSPPVVGGLWVLDKPTWVIFP